MVPIYSLTSWFALILEDEKTILVLELVRDSYEAYVIYNFVVLLINYGGGDLSLCRYLETRPRINHPWPLKLWLPPMKLGPAFLNFVRASVLQFVFVKPAGSFLKVYAYRHGSNSVQSGVRIVIALFSNVSVTLALYGLVLFYHAAHELLLPYHPLPKFLSVKAVVFFSFWQGVVLSIAVQIGLLQDVEGFSAHEQATGLQDFLILCEMAIAAVLHYYVFSYKEYESENPELYADQLRGHRGQSKHPLLRNFGDVVDFRDVLSDAKDRFNGGVGFESELRDSEPMVPSVDNILGEVLPMASAPSYVPPRRVSAGQNDRSSVSADLESTPWRFPAPQPLPLSAQGAPASNSPRTADEKLPLLSRPRTFESRGR